MYNNEAFSYRQNRKLRPSSGQACPKKGKVYKSLHEMHVK
jgi:hypothetical protein